MVSKASQPFLNNFKDYCVYSRCPAEFTTSYSIIRLVIIAT